MNQTAARGRPGRRRPCRAAGARRKDMRTRGVTVRFNVHADAGMSKELTGRYTVVVITPTEVRGAEFIRGGRDAVYTILGRAEGDRWRLVVGDDQLGGLYDGVTVFDDCSPEEISRAVGEMFGLD